MSEYIEKILRPLIKEARKRKTTRIILRGNKYHNDDIVKVANTMPDISKAHQEELPNTMGASVVIELEPPKEIDVSYDGGKTWSKIDEV